MLDRTPWRAALLSLLALLASSCGLLRSAARTPERVAQALMPGVKATAPPIEQQFQDLARYLDQMVQRIEEASQEFEAAAGTPEAELEASRQRLEAIRGATRLAAGQNSLTNALDMLVAASVLRWQLEDYWIPEVWGEAALPLQLAFQRVEEDGWSLLEAYLEEPQVSEARRVLASWREQNPIVERASFAELPSFSALAEGQPAQVQGDAPSLLGLIRLDPLSSLEPATRQIEQARQLGQRGLYFLQRAPRLIAAEIEYRTLALRGSPEARQTLDNAQRVTASLESFAATAAGLPEALRSEREGLVRDLEQQAEPLASLLAQTQATLAAGERMSAEVDTAVRSLDAFVGRFDEPQEPRAQTDPPARPFDVTEYGQAAERVGAGASELTELLGELDRKLPELQRVLDETAARGERSIDHAALRVLQVGLLLIGAAALAAWLVRRLGARAGRRGAA